MEIRLAKTAGFCFGVNRAVELTYGLLAEGHKVATLGPLIHNPQAVEDMRRKGAQVVDTVQDVPAGCEVVIRSHGVPRSVYDELEARGIPYHDATCPFVQKIQRIAAEAEKEGAVLLVAGVMAAVMGLIVLASRKVAGSVTLLIIGVMIGYIANAVIGVLKFFSVEEDIKAYVIWGLGSFARVSGNQMMLFVTIMAVIIPLSFLLIKPLNLLMLGDGYARNLGLNINRARVWVITCAGVLTAIVTAYCGPIIFLGLAVPHLCRAIFQTSDHRVLMPASMLVGASLALLCNLIARLPGFEGALPVNSVTALVGAPVVASVLFRKRKRRDAVEF